MTIALAYNVSVDGHVISYEVRPDTQNLAKKNLERVGLASRVDFKLRDIAEGLDETDADAFFLDVPNPFDYISQVRASLKPGGFFCSLLPTVNQVELLLTALRRGTICLYRSMRSVGSILPNRNRRAFAPRTAWWHIPAF